MSSRFLPLPAAWLSCSWILSRERAGVRGRQGPPLHPVRYSPRNTERMPTILKRGPRRSRVSCGPVEDVLPEEIDLRIANPDPRALSPLILGHRERGGRSGQRPEGVLIVQLEPPEV